MKSIEEIREAFDKVHRRACGESVCYMSIPANPERDADLIVSAAHDELAALREENAKLRAAVKAKGEMLHSVSCFTQRDRTHCVCGADEHNTLVRSLQ